MTRRSTAQRITSLDIETCDLSPWHDARLPAPAPRPIPSAVQRGFRTYLGYEPMRQLPDLDTIAETFHIAAQQSGGLALFRAFCGMMFMEQSDGSAIHVGTLPVTSQVDRQILLEAYAPHL